MMIGRGRMMTGRTVSRLRLWRRLDLTNNRDVATPISDKYISFLRDNGHLHQYDDQSVWDAQLSRRRQGWNSIIINWYHGYTTDGNFILMTLMAVRNWGKLLALVEVNYCRLFDQHCPLHPIFTTSVPPFPIYQLAKLPLLWALVPHVLPAFFNKIGFFMG